MKKAIVSALGTAVIVLAMAQAAPAFAQRNKAIEAAINDCQRNWQAYGFPSISACVIATVLPPDPAPGEEEAMCAALLAYGIHC